MEIELRAKLNNPTGLIQKFRRDKNIKFQGKFLEKDLYLKHRDDKPKGMVIRIRQKNKKFLLTFKSHTTGKDTAWLDLDLPLEKPEILKKILLSNNYYKYVTIEKTRFSFQHKNFEINIDKVKQLGWFIEMEAQGNQAQRPKLEKQIKLFFLKHDIKPTDIIYSGYVPLLLKSST